VHDQGDGLTLNFNGDYPGGVTINGEVNVPGTISADTVYATPFSILGQGQEFLLQGRRRPDAFGPDGGARQPPELRLRSSDPGRCPRKEVTQSATLGGGSLRRLWLVSDCQPTWNASGEVPKAPRSEPTCSPPSHPKHALLAEENWASLQLRRKESLRRDRLHV
jgi:hypothetical protein